MSTSYQDQNTTLDYLIVGQGLAGTLLAHFLLKRGKQILVIDDDYPRASSKIAAGLINPVTGRRHVKTWMIEELLPVAAATYRELESLLGLSLYHERAIIRAFANSGEENDWLARMQDPEYQAYLQARADLGAYEGYIHPAFRYGEIGGSAQVDVPALIKAYRQRLQEMGLLRQEAFDYARLLPAATSVTYQGIQARRIIFCEGSKAVENPYFAYLPFWNSKGEVLIVEVQHMDFKKIIKQGIYLAPMGSQKYWAGATNDRVYEDDLPSNAGAAFLYGRLKALLKVPFRILEHYAALRPTVKDRRPFLGAHPVWPSLFIFNGLGGKGASLGPYWAKKLVAHLEDDIPLDRLVNIERYQAEWQE